jgi:3-oxoacyl-[acyl-carrier protein] reductase
MLKEKIAFVTGGSRGIGAAIAFELANEGALVYVNYFKSKDKADELTQKIIQKGGKAEAIYGSVADEQSIKEMFDLIKSRHNKLDILVNNAGITNDKLLLQMDFAAWDEVIKTNLYSIYYCCKAAIGLMQLNKSGCIVNVSSVSAIKGTEGQSNYSAAKAGITGFTRSLAHEVGRFGIRVNSVLPGLIATEMLNKTPSASLKRVIMHDCLLQRLGRPEEVASVVSFLASEKSSYIQGQSIVVDGGIVI